MVSDEVPIDEEGTVAVVVGAADDGSWWGGVRCEKEEQRDQRECQAEAHGRAPPASRKFQDYLEQQERRWNNC